MVWDSIWSGIKGFFAGILDNLKNLAMTIVENIGVILLVALVVLAIILIIAVIMVLAGAAAGIMAALVAIFAFLGTVLFWVGIVMAIVAVIILIVVIVQVFSDDKLSIYEKWHAIGYAFTDVLLSATEIFAAIKIVGGVGKILKLTGGIGQS